MRTSCTSTRVLRVSQMIRFLELGCITNGCKVLSSLSVSPPEMAASVFRPMTDMVTERCLIARLSGGCSFSHTWHRQRPGVSMESAVSLPFWELRTLGDSPPPGSEGKTRLQSLGCASSLVVLSWTTWLCSAPRLDWATTVSCFCLRQSSNSAKDMSGSGSWAPASGPLDAPVEASGTGLLRGPGGRAAPSTRLMPQLLLGSGPDMEPQPRIPLA
mmetsp:Transcript_50026/g.112396  ORF Transcript_50026/g.112396 Transcript_50026/m.112396 type:complete len:215 (-) Transcript_50026:18-662(-)